MPKALPRVNAYAHAHLREGLGAAAAELHTTRLLVNSAALWWFLTRLTPAQRAEALGEYTKALSLRGQQGQGRPAEG
jgi:hypothetical protein